MSKMIKPLGIFLQGSIKSVCNFFSNHVHELVSHIWFPTTHHFEEHNKPMPYRKDLNWQLSAENTGKDARWSKSSSCLVSNEGSKDINTKVKHHLDFKKQNKSQTLELHNHHRLCKKLLLLSEHNKTMSLNISKKCIFTLFNSTSTRKIFYHYVVVLVLQHCSTATPGFGLWLIHKKKKKKSNHALYCPKSVL